MKTDRTGSRRAGAWLLGLGLLAGPAALPANAQTCPITNDATISGVVNTYYPGLGTVGDGDTSLRVDMNAARGAGEGIAVGDLLLVIQMQDAGIDNNNNSTYGDGVPGDPARGQTDVNDTGLYEFVVSQSAAAAGGGANVTLDITGAGAGNGTINAYDTQARTGAAGQRSYQVIKVARYRNVTLNGVTAAAWNGVTGGVVAIDAAGTLTLTANAVNVTGQGFRGGVGQGLGGEQGLPVAADDYRRRSDVAAHGLKGEGIAGTPSNLTGVGAPTGYPPGAGLSPNGDRARGGPGNAGGGGTDANPTSNDQNTGGGGGANGGQGGDGGHAAFSQAAVGGFGGGAFPATFARLVMGGGGGAGSRDDSSGIQSSGADGGGIVFLRAGGVAGTGTITADGASANAFQPANDGGGGGGAGGSVLVVAPATVSLAGLTILARGGQGSDAWPSQPPGGTPGNRHGPGGGGGGGAIFVSAAVSGATSVAGGANGTTTTANDPYGATPGAGGLGGSVSFGQVPGVETCLAVTRAVVSGVRLTGRQLEFAVTSGRGVAALNVIGEMRDGRRRRLNRETLRPVTADALGPVLFEVPLSGGAPRKIWIEERERTGRVRMLGPYVPGDERQEAAYAGLEERARRSEVREGPLSRMLVRPRVAGALGPDGAAVRGPLPRPPRHARGFKIEIGRAGLVRLPLGDWLPGAVPAGRAGSGPFLNQRIQVTNLGRSIPFEIRDGVLEFHAEALSTDYTGRNVYLVTWGLPPAPSADLTRSGFPREEGWRRVEENVLYAPFAAEGADPWIWDFALEGANGPFVFDLEGASPTKAAVSLRIGLIGATEHLHTVRAEINGVPVGEAVFRGKTMGVLHGGIAGDALRATGNELRLTYEAEASTPDDPGLVFLDVVDVMAPEREGDAEVLAVKPYDPTLPALAGADYLIVTHRDFQDAAERLRALKEGDGLRVAVVDVERAYDRYSAGVFEANAVRELVRAAASRKRLAHVALVGDDTFDPRDFLGLGNASYVPSLYGWDGVFGRVPSETLFADVDDDGRPDVAIGRLPVRTVEEAQAVMDKIARQGRLRRGHLVVADEKRESDISFRGEAEALAGRLPEGSVTMADVGAQGVLAARTTLLEGLRAGPATASYFGHGGEDVWSNQGLLRNADVASLEGSAGETVLFSWTCETQWFVAEGRTISEELLLVPNGGTVASVGPVGISDPVLQVNLARRVYDHFLTGASLGEAVRRAKADALREDPGLAPVVHGFGLIGDPSLTLPLAR